MRAKYCILLIELCLLFSISTTQPKNFQESTTKREAGSRSDSEKHRFHLEIYSNNGRSRPCNDQRGLRTKEQQQVDFYKLHETNEHMKTIRKVWRQVYHKQNYRFEQIEHKIKAMDQEVEIIKAKLDWMR